MPERLPLLLYLHGQGDRWPGNDEMSEVLRLLLEEGKWFNDAEASGKTGDWRWLTDSSIIVTMDPVVEYTASFDRLSRHFACFQMRSRKVPVPRVLRVISENTS